MIKTRTRRARNKNRGRITLQRIPMYINTKTGNIVTGKEFNEQKDGSIILAGYKTVAHRPSNWRDRIAAKKLTY